MPLPDSTTPIPADKTEAASTTPATPAPRGDRFKPRGVQARPRQRTDRPTRSLRSRVQEFKRPSKKTLRVEKAKKGHKQFSVEEIRALVQGVLVAGAEGPELVQASPQLRAMMLLGIN